MKVALLCQAVFSCRKHVTLAGDTFDCHGLVAVLVVFLRVRLGKLLSLFHCVGSGPKC
jgi:hypothetical protein